MNGERNVSGHGFSMGLYIALAEEYTFFCCRLDFEFPVYYGDIDEPTEYCLMTILHFHVSCRIEYSKTKFIYLFIRFI